MRRTVVVVMAASLALGACAHKKPKPAPSAPQSSESNAGAQSGGASGANAGDMSQQESAGPSGGTLATRTVYFDFDSAVIEGQGVEVVAAHAKYLASHTDARVRLEGNTDERGSREYNIGLGERRAQSVRRAMLLQGVSDGQITTVSYGEERPADAGHTEAAWAKNRRVEIVYLTPSSQLPQAPKQ